jgi:hypothetical protein
MTSYETRPFSEYRSKDAASAYPRSMSYRAANARCRSRKSHVCQCMPVTAMEFSTAAVCPCALLSTAEGGAGLVTPACGPEHLASLRPVRGKPGEDAKGPPGPTSCPDGFCQLLAPGFRRGPTPTSRLALRSPPGPASASDWCCEECTSGPAAASGTGTKKRQTRATE